MGAGKTGDAISHQMDTNIYMYAVSSPHIYYLLGLQRFQGAWLRTVNGKPWSKPCAHALTTVMRAAAACLNIVLITSRPLWSSVNRNEHQPMVCFERHSNPQHEDGKGWVLA